MRTLLRVLVVVARRHPRQTARNSLYLRPYGRQVVDESCLHDVCLHTVDLKGNNRGNFLRDASDLAKECHGPGERQGAQLHYMI